MWPLCQWLRDRLHLYSALPPQDIELRNTSRLSGQQRPTTLLHQPTMLKLICALLLELLMTFLHKAKCINHIFPIAETRVSRPRPSPDLHNLNRNPQLGFWFVCDCGKSVANKHSEIWSPEWCFEALMNCEQLIHPFGTNGHNLVYN